MVSSSVTDRTGQTRDLDGRVCLVTGATGGIGKETALALARRGATVVLVGRDFVRANATATEIRGRALGAEVEVLLANLASQRQVRELADAFLLRHDTLHVLVNNAGIVQGPRETTEDGMERTIAVNHLAPFLITTLLMDALRAGGAPGHAARVVTVASDAHQMGRIDLKDLNAERRYGGMRAYCNSKLANVLFTYELARRVARDPRDVTNPISALAIHPGAVGTAWGTGMGGLFALGWKLGKRFMLTPERGARPAIQAAADPTLEGVSGAYITQRGITKSSSGSYNTETAQALWEASERLTGLASTSAG